MADREWVPSRWYLKNVPEHIKNEILGKPSRAKKSKKPIQKRHVYSGPPVVESVMPPIDELLESIRVSSVRAKALLAEFGLSQTNMRKNVR